MWPFKKNETAQTDDAVSPKPKAQTGVSATKILKVADKGVLVGNIGAIVAVYILDAIFFVAWAPSLMLIPVFFLIGIVIRSVAVWTGPIMQVAAKQKDVGRETKTMRALSVAAALLCLIPALSFFAGGHHNATMGADLAGVTAEVSDTNKDAQILTLRDRIDRWDTEKETVRSDAAALIAGARTSMELVLDDGNSTNDDVSAYEANIARYIAERDARLREITTEQTALENQIAQVERDKETVQTSSALEEVRISPVYAIFVVVASVIGDADIWALSILFLFALLVEAIAFFGLGAYQGLHKFFVKAIQRIELEEAEHAGKLEAEIAEMEARVAEAQARAEIIRRGESEEDDELLRQAEAAKRAAETAERIAALDAEAIAARRRADAVRKAAEAPAPDPVEATNDHDLDKPPAPEEPADEPDDEWTEPELTDKQRWSKKGGEANGFYKRAQSQKIPLPAAFPEDIEAELDIAS